MWRWRDEDGEVSIFMLLFRSWRDRIFLQYLHIHGWIQWFLLTRECLLEERWSVRKRSHFWSEGRLETSFGDTFNRDFLSQRPLLIGQTSISWLSHFQTRQHLWYLLCEVNIKGATAEYCKYLRYSNQAQCKIYRQYFRFFCTVLNCALCCLNVQCATALCHWTVQSCKYLQHCIVCTFNVVSTCNVRH